MGRYSQFALAFLSFCTCSIVQGQSAFMPQLKSLPAPLPTEQSLSATTILAMLEDKNVIEREKIVLELLSLGHFPQRLRSLKKVTVEEQKRKISFWVMPDYLAIGNDADEMLMPLSFSSARLLTQSWGFALPTRKMVDAIYKSAERKIWPRTYPPSPEMNSMEFARDHNRWIEGQRYLFPEQDVLTAGHKKDVVLSKRLYQRHNRQAIYGWNNIRAGETIQPLSIWHGEKYVDYSHGLRMVAPWVEIDGVLVSLKQALMHEEYSSLLSDEGPLDIDRLLRHTDHSIAHN